MPQVILGLAGLSASIFGGGAAITTGLVGLYGFSTTAFGGALISGAVSVGLNFLSAALFRERPPQPEDGQASYRQPGQWRVRHYGRVKVSGPWVIAGTKQGTFGKGIILGEGPIDAVEETWIDDTPVSFSGNEVITDPYVVDGISRVLVEYRVGSVPSTPLGLLTSLFPEYDTDCRGDGLAMMAIQQRGLPADRFYEIFPNSINTAYRAVLRGALVKNLATGVTEWSDNAADVIHDYLRHETGMRLPASLFETAQAVAGWQAARAVCAEAVTLKAGGTIPRYRIWGSYRLDERPADVLARLLSACDGRLAPTPDGGLVLQVRTGATPAVTLGESEVTHIVSLKRGRDVVSTANAISATYTEPEQDYQGTDADLWIDEEDAGARGEIRRDLPLTMVPHHAQARRLMKIEAYRANPDWIGVLAFQPSALRAYGEDRVTLSLPRFGLSIDAEVDDFRIEIDPETKLLAGVTLAFHAMPAEAWSWNPADEEGAAPARNDVSETSTIPVPESLAVSTVRKAAAGSIVPFGRLVMSTPPSSSLSLQARGKRVADSEWLPIQVALGATEAESFALSDGETYEFQARHVSMTGRPGAWTASETLTPTAALTEPLALAAFSATGGTGEATVSLTTQSDGALHHVDLYRTPDGDAFSEGDDLVATVYPPQAVATSYPIAGDPGDYVFRAIPRNASNVAGPTATASVVTIS